MTDNTDTYNISFLASGVGIFCSGILLLVTPALRRCDHVAVNTDSKSEESNDEDTSSREAAAAENLPSASGDSR